MGRPRILFFLLLFSLVFVACDKIEQGSLDVINPEINEEENRAVEEEIEAIELQVPNEVKEAHEESIDIEQPVSQVNEPIVDDQGENLVQVLKSDRILSAGPFYGVLPQIYWSPLGTHLAIKGAAAGQGVWVLDLKKEQIHQAIRLPQRIDSNCTNLQILGWSADGEKLYFIIEGLQVTEPYLGKTGLFLGEVVLADGSATVAEVLWVQDGYSGISQFKLVKDNNFLLCHRAGELWRINIQTAAKELLAANLPQWDGLFQVTFSPTGKYIAYQLERNGKNGIAILNTENGHEAVLLENHDYHFFPVWNPAEDKIAFLTGVALQGEGYDYYQGEDGALPPATKIQVYNVEGEQIVTYQLEGEKVGAPYWSNNSEYLAFLSARWENESNFWEPDFIWDGIYEVGLAGGEPQKILELEGEWFSVGGWSPDNERISIFRYDADGSSSLLVLNRHSSRLELTVREAMDEPLQWYKSGLLVGKVLEGTNGLYTEVFYIDQGGRERSLTNNGGWKNSFLLWADRLAYVRGDTIHSSYPLYVEILALP